ncbi:unnamed protein product [Symbiodinium natans]|uniref:Uncharacterized protein n=1 Tax=Symbiodinium natans TaxID=878477 RepID=A0A812GJY8_9DINO|nr:unnamed protein product [Symbiodinium natans]
MPAFQRTDGCGSCVKGLCILWRRSDGKDVAQHGFFGEGLAEVAALREDSVLIPDRLIIAESGDRGPSEGKLGALALAIGLRLDKSPCRQDVCLLLYRTSCGETGQLLAEVGTDLQAAGSGTAVGATTTALAKLLLRQAARSPLEGVTGVVLAGGKPHTCPTPSLLDRELMSQHLKPQVPVLCAWISDNPSPAGRMKLWSSTVATLYPWSTKRPLQDEILELELSHKRLFHETWQAACPEEPSSRYTGFAIGVLSASGRSRAFSSSEVGTSMTTHPRCLDEEVMLLASCLKECTKESDNPTLLVLVDADGRLCAPQAQAREYLLRHGFANLQVLVNDEVKAEMLTVREL